MNNQFKVLAVICTLMFTFCTNVEFNNPLDSKGTNPFNAEKLKDDDGNGVPNIYEDDDRDGTLNIDDPDSQLHVVDTIKPVFSKPGNDTVSIALGGGDVFDKSVADFKASVKATDNLEGDISNSISINESVSSLSARVSPVVFTVSDKDGNTASITRYIRTYTPTVEDKTPPVISFGYDTVVIMVGDHYIEQPTTAYDLFDANNVPVTSTGKVDTSKAGTYFVVYTAKDKSNNITTKTKTVIVEAGTDVDTTKPVLSVTGGLTTYSLAIGSKAKVVTANDNVDGVLTDFVKRTGNFDSTKSGVYTLTYSVSDKAGNAASIQVTITVTAVVVDTDTTKPVFTVAGGLTAYSLAIGSKAKVVTANDNVDGVLTDFVKRTGNFDSTKSGVYTLTYSVSDKAGNAASIQVTITVTAVVVDKDTTKPVLSVTGGLTTYSLAIGSKTKVVTAKDSVDGDLTNFVKRTGNFDSTKSGVYTLTYSVSDKAGNSASIQVTITVTAVVVDKDTTKPVITLKGKNPDIVGVDSIGSYVDSGATAKDSGKTIAAPTVSGTVNLKTIGSYTLTYTATDAAGNVATATRTVVVNEVSKDLLIKYGVPGSNPFAVINKEFKSYVTEPVGKISIEGFVSLQFNWGGSGTSMYGFRISTGSVPPYDNDLGSKSTINLGSSSPSITLTGTNVTGLDADYYVTLSGTNMVWVKKDGSFAIIWTP